MALPWKQIFKIGSQVLGSIAGAKSAFGDQGGGVGGATSAQTQGGQTGLQYQDVGGTEVTPFEYEELLNRLQEEDEQREIAEAMALAQQQGLWSGGIIGLMQGGPLYANEGSPLSPAELEKWIGEKPSRMKPMSLPPDPEITTFVTRGAHTESDEDVPEIVVEEAQVTPGTTIEDLKADLAQIAKQQDMRDTFETVDDLIEIIGKMRNPQKSTISPRKSVTPLPGGGLGKRQAPYPQPKGSGITPFMFQPAAGGGALGRSMFAQNYMPNGGAMRGPGGPKDDLIPVMASDGEYMLSKAAVDQAGGGNHRKGIARLEQFNQLGNRRYG